MNLRNIKINRVDEIIIIILLSLYASKQAELFFHVQLFDLILIITLGRIFTKGLHIDRKKVVLFYISLSLFVFIILFHLLIVDNTIFLLSELRNIIYIIVFSYYIKLLNICDLNTNRIIPTSLFIILVLYSFNYLGFSLDFIYQSFDNKNTNQLVNRYRGPSTIGVYLIFMVSVYHKKVSKKTTYLFTISVLIVYFFNESRMNFVLGFTAVMFYLLYSVKNALIIAVRSLVIITPLLIFLSWYKVDRLATILDPFSDSSFLYRIYLNTRFVQQIDQYSILELLVGHGIGSTMYLYYNKIINGVFVIIDNSFLTIFYKLGLTGLLTFCLYIYSCIKSKGILTLFLILFFLVASMLTAHIYTNMHYLALLAFLKDE